jgi:hypothetical protein
MGLPAPNGTGSSGLSAELDEREREHVDTQLNVGSMKCKGQPTVDAAAGMR